MAIRIIEIREDTGAETATIRRLNQAAGATDDDVISAVAATRYVNLTGTLPDEATSRLLKFDLAPISENDD